MKVAVCISGHLRDGDKTSLPALKQFLLGKYECDIFISTWDLNCFGEQMCQQPNFFGSKNIDNISERIIAGYTPKKFIIETEESDWYVRLKKFWGNQTLREGRGYIFSMLSMFKKIESADLLRQQYQDETKTKYDLVVRIRFDVELVSDIIEQAKPDISNGVIVKKQNSGIVDCLFFGDVENMTRACKCYSSNTVTPGNYKTMGSGEHILQSHFNNFKIPHVFRNDIHFRGNFRPNSSRLWGNDV